MEDYPFSEKTRIIWKQFIRQFQEESIASYQSDFLEFTRFTKKDFLDIHARHADAAMSCRANANHPTAKYSAKSAPLSTR